MAQNGPRTQLTTLFLCVSVTVTACGKVSNKRPTPTLCGHILHHYLLTAAQGVTRFACQSSGPPPVSVGLTAANVSAHFSCFKYHSRKEWGGYETCVRVTAALEVMCLRGCIHWHCFGQTGVSVLPPVCPQLTLTANKMFYFMGRWKMLKTGRKHSRHEAPVFLSFSFSCYEFLDLCPWETFWTWAGYFTETVWLMWLKWKGLVFWGHVNDGVEKCHLSRSWLGGGVFLLGISGQVSASAVASSAPSCRQQLSSVTGCKTDMQCE